MFILVFVRLFFFCVVASTNVANVQCIKCKMGEAWKNTQKLQWYRENNRMTERSKKKTSKVMRTQKGMKEWTGFFSLFYRFVELHHTNIKSLVVLGRIIMYVVQHLNTESYTTVNHVCDNLLFKRILHIAQQSERLLVAFTYCYWSLHRFFFRPLFILKCEC